MLKTTWTKPFSRPSIKTKSCWLCDHIRVGGQFNRKCILRNVFIWGGDAESEKRETGQIIADSCEKFLNWKKI
jgi:hypothetical protein